MIKTRLSRVKKDNPHSGGKEFDGAFVNGSIREFPRLGMSFVFDYGKLGGEWLRTSTVMKVQWNTDLIRFETINSVYVLKSGWEDTGKQPRKFAGEFKEAS